MATWDVVANKRMSVVYKVTFEVTADSYSDAKKLALSKAKSIDPESLDDDDDGVCVEIVDTDSNSRVDSLTEQEDEP